MRQVTGESGARDCRGRDGTGGGGTGRVHVTEGSLDEVDLISCVGTLPTFVSPLRPGQQKLMTKKRIEVNQSCL